MLQDMSRTKNLISFPRFNTYGCNPTKKWYVEYAYRTPDSDQEHRHRVYTGLCDGTIEERLKRGEELVASLTHWLKSGEYLRQEGCLRALKENETNRPEGALYAKALRVSKIDYWLKEYLAYIKPGLRISSYRTYKGELLFLKEYIEGELGNPSVFTLTRKDILPFFLRLADDKGLTRKTISKYQGRVYNLFAYIDRNSNGQMVKNPVYDIPRLGKIVDCSCVPVDADDRARLRAAIKPRQPFLWLACELEYYCAIRPGHEIRLLKVGDIDRENKTITIRAEIAKNKQTEKVDVPTCVLNLMEELGIFNYAPDLYIFTRYGYPGTQPLGISTLRARYNQYRKELGISERKTFYSWKHAGAISAARNGMPIIDLRDHMRHKSVATTEAYLRKYVPKKGVVEKYIDEI